MAQFNFDGLDNDEASLLNMNSNVNYDFLRRDRENPIADVLRDLNINSNYYDEIGFFNLYRDKNNLLILLSFSSITIL